MKPDEFLHAKTFGAGGSFPRAVCGYRGEGSGGRMHFASPAVLLDPGLRRRPPCPDCLQAIIERTPQ